MTVFRLLEDNEVLKQVEKQEFSRLALSFSVPAETSLRVKVGTEQALLFGCLMVFQTFF